MLLDKKERVAFFLTFFLLLAASFAFASVSMMILPKAPIQQAQARDVLSFPDRFAETTYVEEVLTDALFMQYQAIRSIYASA